MMARVRYIQNKSKWGDKQRANISNWGDKHKRQKNSDKHKGQTNVGKWGDKPKGF